MVMEPVDANKLSKKGKSASLQYIMFFKKKRSRKIKGRGCADGQKERLYMSKDKVISSTVATKALLLTCLINSMEGRDIATVYIPGAFMQSDMEGGDTFMKLEEKTVSILDKIDPKMYKQDVMSKNGKNVLYVKLKKALYGTLQASLLF